MHNNSVQHTARTRGHKRGAIENKSRVWLRKRRRLLARACTSVPGTAKAMPLEAGFPGHCIICWRFVANCGRLEVVAFAANAQRGSSMQHLLFGGLHRLIIAASLNRERYKRGRRFVLAAPSPRKETENKTESARNWGTKQRTRRL